MNGLGACTSRPHKAHDSTRQVGSLDAISRACPCDGVRVSAIRPPGSVRPSGLAEGLPRTSSSSSNVSSTVSRFARSRNDVSGVNCPVISALLVQSRGIIPVSESLKQSGHDPWRSRRPSWQGGCATGPCYGRVSAQSSVALDPAIGCCPIYFRAFRSRVNRAFSCRAFRAIRRVPFIGPP